MQRLIGASLVGLGDVLGLTPPPGEWPWQAHAGDVAARIAHSVAVGLMLAAGDDD